MKQKQSGYFMDLKDPNDYRLAALEDRLQSNEEAMSKKVEHLEERIRQVNFKFERIEQLGDRIESLNQLMDSLKANFDAKLVVYEDKLNSMNTKMGKMKPQIDELLSLYSIVKKTVHNQKEIQNELQNMREIQTMPSQSMILKQSNVLTDKRVQSPQLRINNDRVRSITLEKQLMQMRQQTEENHDPQIDKYQFTLQSKVIQDENYPRPDTRMQSKTKKSETLTVESGKIINQQTLLERTISQDHIPRSKYLSSTNQMQLKNLRK